MTRSVQQLLDHADQLAAWFENFEPQPGDERPVEEYLLGRAVMARAKSKQGIAEAVLAARSAGIAWSRIGEFLGTTAEIAQRRYATGDESV